MGDTVKSTPIIGLPATLLGLAAMTDNHGNSMSQKLLTCRGAPPRELIPEEAIDLYLAITKPHDNISKAELHTILTQPETMLAAIGRSVERTIRGEVTLGNLESPLKTKCDQLAAQKPKPETHHAPKRGR